MTEAWRGHVAYIVGLELLLSLLACDATRATSMPTPTEPPASPTPTPPPASTPTPTLLPGLTVEAGANETSFIPTPSPFSPPTNGTTANGAGPGPTILPSPTPTPAPPPETPTTAVFQLPDIAGVVERARPAVVSIIAQVLVRDFFGRVVLDTQSGSGVIFDPRGYILTNNHVVGNAESITVTLDDGRQFEAEINGTDRLTDLAVLRIDGEGLPSVPMGDPSSVRVGDWVIAIGNALALPGGPTVTVRVISALDRAFPIRPDFQLYDLIQTDASINPGNSGGPLLNLRGEVVGINTAVARSDLEARGVEGIGFAIGMDTAVPVAQALLENGSVQWAWLGVILDDLDAQSAAQVGVPIREGVLIVDIVREGPAWQAGIRRLDVVVSMGGAKVSTVRDLIRLLRLDHGVGEKVELKVFREKQELTLEVTLGERPTQ